MKKVDFRRIEVENIEGAVELADVTRELGNRMYMQGRNIDECELGRTIYLSGKVEADNESFVEISTEQAAMVKKFVADWGYVLRKAVERAINE